MSKEQYEMPEIAMSALGEDVIPIQRSKYERLVSDANAGRMLAYTILHGAELNYRHDGLDFSDTVTNAAVKAFDYTGWKYTMDELTDEAKKKEAKE